MVIRRMAKAHASILALGALSLLNACRGETSNKPPVHIVLDMDFQQKLKAQSEFDFEGWTDHRGARPPVAHTLARGGKVAGSPPGEYYVPAVGEIFASFDADSDGKLNRMEVKNLPFSRFRVFTLADRDGDRLLDRNEVAAISAIYTHTNADGSFVENNPLPATPEILQRGRERFNIHCGVCHGLDAKGGMVARRWPVAIPDLVEHSDATTRARLVSLRLGEIFDTITKGKGTMPSYAQQISVEDRWAITHYVKALQNYFNE